jgi:hypothetical protein
LPVSAAEPFDPVFLDIPPLTASSLNSSDFRNLGRKRHQKIVENSRFYRHSPARFKKVDNCDSVKLAVPRAVLGAMSAPSLSGE